MRVMLVDDDMVVLSTVRCEHGEKWWDGKVIETAGSAGKEGEKRRAGSDGWVVRRRVGLMPVIRLCCIGCNAAS